jgi:Tfp pilus assembly protein PilF
VADLRKSLEINPQHGPTHFVLAWVLGKQGKLGGARDEYRVALLYDSLLSAEDKATVLRAIADINEKLPAK